MAEKKKELEALLKEKINGIMIRSRAHWLSESEKPSKYFCSLEKHYYTEKTIEKIITDSGTILTKQKQILNEVKNYYKDLFKGRDDTVLGIQSSDLNFLDGAAKLSDNKADALEGHLTLEEISNALKSMKNQKTPGIDGFPAEFFKVFWGKIKYFVLRSLNQMSLTPRQCIISCLPKGDKPRQFLKNWRPISLLSVIYKIASAALAS